MLFRRKKVFDSNIDYIVAGLGNPGMSYELTRHNAGFMAIDFIAKQVDAKLEKEKFHSLCCTTNINGKKVLLMKPQTYMNLSGEAVIDAMDFYKVPVENVIVLFDDISLSPGKLRIKRRGSDGGHNGIKNIIFLTGQDTFPRIKIGVGSKPNPDWDLADWVLSRFTEDELNKMNTSIENAFSALTLILEDHIDKAMNKYNS